MEFGKSRRPGAVRPGSRCSDRGRPEALRVHFVRHAARGPPALL